MHKISISSFDDFNFNPSLVKAIIKLGFTLPTLIQDQAIPIILESRDILASAQTGSGKTAAFAMPIIQKILHLANDSPSPAKHPVLALILAPTRELAHQIYKVFCELSEFTSLKIGVLVGGEPIESQKQLLQKGLDVIIATPGRLYDHITLGSIKLGKVQILTLDEADKMLDMGFLPDLEKIFEYLPKERQTLLFSATFSQYIKKLTQQYQNDPVLIEAHSSNSSNTNVSQYMYLLSEYQKLSTLKNILKESEGQCMVFTNSKIDCKKLQLDLQDTHNSLAIHGDMTQSQRIEHLNSFKTNQTKVLVATDVAARGLDIPDLPLVINYTLPFNAEDYVHRIGRTGRAGKNGKAISLYSTKDNKFKDAIEALIGKDIIEHKNLCTNENKSSSSTNNSTSKIKDCALFRLKINSFN